MFYLLSSMINKAVFPDEKADHSHAVSLQNHGPGQIEKWQALKGEENCWVQHQAITHKPPRKKIIFCYPWLNRRAPYLAELTMWNTLVDEHDIYLWEGENTHIHNARPIADTIAFWQKLDTTVPATAESVKQALGKMPNVNANEYVIFDHAEYHNVLARLSRESSTDSESIKLLIPEQIYSSSTLNLQNNPPKTAKDFESLLSQINPAKTRTIIVSELNENDVTFIRAHFSIHTAIHVTKVSSKESFIHLASLSDYYIQIDRCSEILLFSFSGSNTLYKSIIIDFSFMKKSTIVVYNPQKKPLGNLVIKNCYCENDQDALGILNNLQYFNSVSLENSSTLQKTAASINAKNVLSPLEDKTDNSPTAKKSVKIIDNSLFATKPSTITVTRIRAPNDDELAPHETLIGQDYKPSYSPHITGVIVHLSVSDITVNWQDFPNLEVLRLIDISHDTVTSIDYELPNRFSDFLNSIDFKQLPHLKSLHLITKSDFHKSPLRISSPTLRNLEISNFGGEKIDVSQLPLLQSLLVRESYFLLSIKSQSSTKITALLLSKNSKLADIDDTILENVFYLNINDCPDFDERAANEYYCMGRIPQLRTFKVDGDNIPTINVASTANKSEEISIATTSSSNNLEKFNKNSPVAIFNLNDDTNVDDNTNSNNNPIQQTGNFRAALYGKNINRNQYRIHIYNDIQIHNDKITFVKRHIISPKSTPIPTKSLDSITMKELEKFVDSNSEYALGKLSGNIQPEKYYPLPTQESLTENSPFSIYCNPENAIDVFWSPIWQMYVFKLKGNEPCDIQIAYQFKRNPAYNTNKTKSEPALEEESLLSPELNTLIQDKLISKIITYNKTHKDTPHPLTFLTENLSHAEKIKKLDSLKEYCIFPTEDTKSVTDNMTNRSDIDKLIYTILERKGVCRHRSKAFMLLSRFMGFHTRMVENGVGDHAFCEIPYADESLHRFDLGGGAVIDHTPAHERSNFFTSLTTLTRVAEKKVHNPARETYTKIFSDLEKITPLESIAELHIKDSKSTTKKLSPLIILNNPSDISSIKQHIKQQLEALNKKNYIFIDTPQDFKDYFEHHYITNGEPLVTKGPLHSLIKQSGTLVVNWNNFSAAQRVRYQCILDKPPTLHEETLSPVLTIIGLGSKQSLEEPAFASRCSPYVLNTIPTLQQDTSSNKKPLEIDLFESPNWREYLLGDIQFEDNTVSVSKGKLIEAIETDTPLIIYNPPHDPAFDLLLKKIRDEKRILHNNIKGEFTAIPNNMHIETKQKPHSLEASNVLLLTTKPEKNQQLVYVNLHNLHELFEQLQINEKSHQAKNLPGLLEQYDEKTAVFYITDTIKKMDWEKILYKIQEKYPKKQFNFVLAPNAGILDYKLNPAVYDHNTACAQNIILSNDRDYFINQNTDKQTLIIDITSNTTLSELLTRLKIEKDKTHPGKINFSYEEKGLLTALLKKQKVILNGEPSLALYQQLLPLLGEQPYILKNSEKIPIQPGQLRLVMPESVKKTLPLHQFIEKSYSLKDFKMESPEDEALKNKIIQFYSIANKLAHSAPGFPKRPILNHTKLLNTLHLLKNGSLHKQNPIKGVFLYDYPKDSEEYAFLNVVAKYLFSTDKNTYYFNLSKYIHTNKKNGSSFWRYMNCFSANSIHKIFENNLPADFSIQSDLMEKLNKASDNHRDHDKLARKSKNRSTVKKRENQLSALLDNPNKSLIIIKGPAGAGKTHTVKALKNKTYCEGDTKGIIEWLENKKQILLLDEGNMASPGSWDFLKGIIRTNRTVYYHGKEYTLNPQQKIIVTGNPENFPGRYYHDFFQDYGETLYFGMPTHDDLKKIIEPILGDQYISVTDKLLSAYRLIQKHNPLFGYSTRDLQNLAQRFICVTNPKNKNHDSSILNACITEFAGTLSSSIKRQLFITELSDNLEIPLSKNYHTPLIELKASDKTYFVPQEMHYLIQGIEQALKMRSNTNAEYIKQGVLLEGDPGLGKSFLLRTLLEIQGFKKGDAAHDPKKRYYEINAGDASAHATLEKAYQEEAIVILNEINLDKSLETKLNQYLASNTNKKFMVFASQNASHHQGREAVSQAVYNRMHVMHIDAYSKEALIAIAEKNGVKSAVDFVDVFLEKKLSMRLFYPAMEIAARAPEVHSTPIQAGMFAATTAAIPPAMPSDTHQPKPGRAL